MVIHGTGCCLADILYARGDFSTPAFKRARSRKEGDGGLTPGRLVFAEDFERFAGKPYEAALAEITGGPPDSRNLGGPSAVSLAHAAQVLGDAAEVRYYGMRGSGEAGDFVEASLARFPFKAFHLMRKEGAEPRTDVISDPRYDNGHGERTFINLLGAASRFAPEDLDDSFFDAGIVAFGGTALVPLLHDGLTSLLKRAGDRGAVRVVNLAYDFRSEAAFPGKKWKLGRDDDAYPHIDLLIADKDEALKTSGTPGSGEALRWFLAQGVAAVILTDGSRPVRFAASGKDIFSPVEGRSLPVCEKINRELAGHPERRGDTTGCGDNFSGGVIASLAEQLAAAPGGRADLGECAVQGTAAGGFACFTLGGAFYERYPGEKRALLTPYIEACRNQASSGTGSLPPPS
ncbi:MAG: carbohydrate kinase family protein [Treponema sp.]|jgi:sugar/nucleoside kinase (ribokinase family)|nr:carbohydrate kinase family protein [Treponema sp.]